MSRSTRRPFLLAAAPLLGLGATFAAIGAAGQPAFAYVAAGLLLPGAMLLLIGHHYRRPRALR